jgi:hypothetical protein
MVIVAPEEGEPPGGRLVDDDLAVRFLPATVRRLLTATPRNLLRRRDGDGTRRSLADSRSCACHVGGTAASRLVFTYVRKDFINVINRYGAEPLYRRFRLRQVVWDFGIQPAEVSKFLNGHGWRLIEQAGPDLIVQRYIVPTGRSLLASPIEWSAYAEKI